MYINDISKGTAKKELIFPYLALMLISTMGDYKWFLRASAEGMYEYISRCQSFKSY